MHQVRLGLGDARPATNPNIRPLKSLRARRPSQPGLSFERTDAVNCFRGHQESFDGMVSASHAPRSTSARCWRVTLQDDYHIAKHTLGWDLPRAISLVVPQAELRKAPPERNPQRLIRSATGRQASVGEAVAELKQRFDQMERILMKRQRNGAGQQQLHQPESPPLRQPRGGNLMSSQRDSVSPRGHGDLNHDENIDAHPEGRQVWFPDRELQVSPDKCERAFRACNQPENDASEHGGRMCPDAAPEKSPAPTGYGEGWPFKSVRAEDSAIHTVAEHIGESSTNFKDRRVPNASAPASRCQIHANAPTSRRQFNQPVKMRGLKPELTPSQSTQAQDILFRGIDMETSLISG